MSILKAIFETLPIGADAGDGEVAASDEPGAVPASFVAAQAAIDQAIRQQKAGAGSDRRDHHQPDRRITPGETGPDGYDRRSAGDRRLKQPSFGRRTRV